LGFPPEYAQMFWDDYAARADDYVLPSFAPPFMEAILSNLLIGQSTGMEKPGGQWYSAIMPLGTVTDPEVKNNLIFIADQYEWAAALNKAEMVSAELDRLTAAMIRLFGIAYGIIVLGILCYYRNISRTLKVAAIPIFAALANLAVYAQSGLSLSFFSVSGFIMVLGLGLDYMFYLGENSAVPQRDDVNLAVILSYVTTAISFGALIFSSFMPVHLLALSVFPGLSAAFAWAMLVKN
jgi:predicted exporter